jgi:predicted RNase H-like HicB family nuclease
MPNTYTAVTKQDGEWWIGWIAEIPGVNCQERTRAELLASLKTTLAEALEFNRQDAVRAAEPGYTEERVTV